MTERAFWVSEFRFTDEQRESLRPDLSDLDYLADHYLTSIEPMVAIFLAEWRDLQSHPAPGIKSIRKSLARIDELAGELHDRIENLDLLGDEPELLYTLAGMQQPANFFDDLQRQLMTLKTAASAALTRLPQPPVGRPPKDHDARFIASLALAYEHLKGQLPPPAQGSWFCAFVDDLYSNLPKVGDLATPEHYRLVRSAIAAIEGMRGDQSTPPGSGPEDSPE